MVYHTPELLLVGSARSLVLGTDVKWNPDLNVDASGPGEIYTPEITGNPDDSSW